MMICQPDELLQAKSFPEIVHNRFREALDLVQDSAEAQRRDVWDLRAASWLLWVIDSDHGEMIQGLVAETHKIEDRLDLIHQRLRHVRSVYDQIRHKDITT